MRTVLTFIRAAALLGVLASGAHGAGGQVTIKEMIGDPRYWPPACDSVVCVLTGLGGIVQVWLKHVDRNLALGRTFVVRGICASACEMAARRAKAKLLPGAELTSRTRSDRPSGSRYECPTSTRGEGGPVGGSAYSPSSSSSPARKASISSISALKS
jgi:hypothetical protein